MHRLLERQVARATKSGAKLDLTVLLALVDAAYHEADVERIRTDRAMLLTCQEMETLNAELQTLALHDALTGLPNRLFFASAAIRAIQRARQGESLAVLLVDLDRFKLINDTLGHAMGDALLCQVAERLRGAVREGDTVARMGGDEFAILQVGFDSPANAEDMARRVVRGLSGPYVMHGSTLRVGASVGIVRAENPSTDTVDLLLQKADLALYRAKHEGRCTWRIYDQSMAKSPNEAFANDRTSATMDAH